MQGGLKQGARGRPGPCTEVRRRQQVAMETGSSRPTHHPAKKRKRRRKSSHTSSNRRNEDACDRIESEAHVGNSKYNDDPTHTAVECSSILSVNFDSFAKKYADFAKAWADLKSRRTAATNYTATASSTALSRKSSSSFSTHVDAAFNLALTRAILKDNFHLSLPSMPDGYLCPPVPNRLNYVLWMNSLLEQSCDRRYFDLPSSGSSTDSDEERYRLKGIDIGCGASCIYPLLLCTDKFCPTSSVESPYAGAGAGGADADAGGSGGGGGGSGGDGKGWKFFAVDIDEESVRSAKQNVEANDLQNRIDVKLVRKTKRQMIPTLQEHGDEEDIDLRGPLRIAIDTYGDEYQTEKSEKSNSQFDFCMTNPPFYGTEAEATANRKGDGRSRTDMNLSEGVYPDGEVGFIRDMIVDSVHCSQAVFWYTSLISKKASLVELERELRTRFGRGAVRSATFLQGKTTRWGVAWTHQPVAPRSPATKVLGGLQRFEVTVPHNCEKSPVDEVACRVSAYCDWIALTKNMNLQCSVNERSSATRRDPCASDEKSNWSCTISGKAMGAPDDSFLIDVDIEGTLAASDGRATVNVALCCFGYSIEGSAEVEKFRSGIQGEIQRSNRRWRRMMSGTKGCDGVGYKSV